MQKIMAIIMAVLMAVVSSIIPGFAMPGTVTVSEGEYLAGLNTAFGYTASTNTTPVYANVTSDNEYFVAVQTAAEYDVLVDYSEIDTDANVTDEFVATTLVNAARLTAKGDEVTIQNAAKLQNPAKDAIAVQNGIVSLDVLGRISTAAMSAEDVKTAVSAAVALANNKTFKASDYDLEVADGVKDLSAVTDFSVDGNTVTLPEGTDVDAGDIYVVGSEAYKADSVKTAADGSVVTTVEDVAAEDVIKSIDYQGSEAANLAAAKITDGNGNVVSEGIDTSVVGTDSIDYKALVKKALVKIGNISFSVGGFKIKAKVTEGGVNFGIAKSFANGGASLSKYYELTNIDLNTKVDADISTLKMNEVYLDFNYDCVETTSLSGSYAASLAEKASESGDAVSFVDAVKQGLLTVSSGENTVNLLNFSIPIGTTSLTIDLTLQLVIGVDGTISVQVTSKDTNGYEIVNNKGRFIHEQEVLDRKVNANGNFSVQLGVGVGLGIFGYTIVDVAVRGGVGASIYTTVSFTDAQGAVTSTSTAKVAVDAIETLIVGCNFEGDPVVSGHVNVYGLLSVSVGKNSLIKKIGLSKTWTIFDESNATFYTYSFGTQA